MAGEYPEPAGVERVETFGERLRRLRTAGALSCSDLAYRVGVTEGAIRQIETGRTKSASFAIGLKLAKVLDVDPWMLATGIGDKRDSQRGSQAASLKDRVTQLEERLERVERELAGRSSVRRSTVGRR